MAKRIGYFTAFLVCFGFFMYLIDFFLMKAQGLPLIP